jgi:hypothetical protein
MRSLLIYALLLGSSAAAGAKDEDRVYEGTWVTTNRPLQGTLTCVVTDLGDNQWRGHFSGAWNGQQFAYKVNFSGSPDKLRGHAVIDGADYEWAGEMGKEFKGKFWGNRYAGSFALKKKGE